MEAPGTILYCHCAHYEVVPAETRLGVLGQLRSAGTAFEAVADLCGLAARRDPLLGRLARAETLAVVACYPRAVKWLFAFADAPLDETRVRFFNMRTQSAGEIVSALLGRSAGQEAPPAPQGPPERPGTGESWVPWFPVIDGDRCQNCKQCLDFCLFGVYETDADGKVRVANPANCKTNCPACARICPASAIMFPKCADGAIAGQEPDRAPGKGGPVRVNLAELLAGDVRAALRARHAAPGAADEPALTDLPADLAALSGPEVPTSDGPGGTGCSCQPRSTPAPPDDSCSCDQSADS